MCGTSLSSRRWSGEERENLQSLARCARGLFSKEVLSTVGYGEVWSEAVILVLQEVYKILLVVLPARDIFSRFRNPFCKHKTSSWHLVNICGSGCACSKQRLINDRNEKESPQFLFALFLSHLQCSTSQHMIMTDLLTLRYSFDALCWSTRQQWYCSSLHY